MKKILLVMLCIVMVFGTSTALASDSVTGNPTNEEATAEEPDKEKEEERKKKEKDDADLAAATDLVAKAEAVNPIAANSKAINKAQDLLDKATEAVKTLESSKEKTALEEKIKAQQALINATNLQRLKYNANHHVSNFEANPTDETLATKAQAAINALPANKRAPYQARYNATVADAEASALASALASAREAVADADVAPLRNASQISIAQGLLNDAKALVGALPKSKDKEALVQDVARIQYEIDSSRQRLTDDAEYHVSRFEANPTDETLKTNAQLAIRALPENERANFQTRYNKVTTEAIEEVTRKTFYTFQIGNEFYTYRNANGNVTRYLMDVKPYILNDRTMLPMRYTAYTLGLQVAYDDTTRMATFFDRDTVVTIDIDSNEVKLNGLVVRLDAPVQNVGDRLMTPVSQIARLFGKTNGDWNDGIAQDIEWVSEHRLVFIFD